MEERKKVEGRKPPDFKFILFGTNTWDINEYLYSHIHQKLNLGKAPNKLSNNSVLTYEYTDSKNVTFFYVYFPINNLDTLKAVLKAPDMLFKDVNGCTFVNLKEMDPRIVQSLLEICVRRQIPAMDSNDLSMAIESEIQEEKKEDGDKEFPTEEISSDNVLNIQEDRTEVKDKKSEEDELDEDWEIIEESSEDLEEKAKKAEKASRGSFIKMFQRKETDEKSVNSEPPNQDRRRWSLFEKVKDAFSDAKSNSKEEVKKDPKKEPQKDFQKEPPKEIKLERKIPFEKINLDALSSDDDNSAPSSGAGSDADDESESFSDSKTKGNKAPPRKNN